MLQRRLYRLLHRPPDTPFERAKKAPFYFIMDYTFAMAAYFMLIGNLTAKLTAYYEFSVAVSTTISTLPALLTIVEFLSNRYFPHLRKLAVIWRLALPLVLASVFLPKSIGSIVMVTAYTVMCVAFHVYQPSYNAYTVNVTQGHIRSNYFSTRETFFLPTSTAINFLVAAVISRAEANGDISTGFAQLSLVMLLMVLPSLWLILHALPNPNAPSIGADGQVAPSETSNADGTPKKKLSFLEEVKMVLADKHYRNFLIFHLAWQYFFQFSGFLAVFQIQVLEQDYLTLTMYLTVSNGLRIALLPVFAWLGVKHGWKLVVQICFILMGIGTACWVFITPANLWLLFPLGVLLQAPPWAGLGIGIFYFQIAYTKTETRSVYFSAHAGIAGLVACLGVLSCNTLVSLLGKMEQPTYWVIFALWLLGIFITLLLVTRTPFPKE